MLKNVKKYAIKTFGCQMNYSDSERVRGVLDQCGFRLAREEEKPDITIINTCSVRQKSEDKAIGFVAKVKKENPSGLVIVTGCMVRQTGDRHTSHDALLQLDTVDLVFRIEDCARLPKMLEKYFPRHDFSEFGKVFGTGTIENYFHITPRVQNRRQVFVPIMQGCDKFCTFCIVPYTRGREISRPMDEILFECEQHVKNGAIEITLLGQNVNSYRDGLGGPKCFSDLLQAVDKLSKKGLSRLRFTSAHPQDFTDDVIETLANTKTSCPYIHLPAQHGSNEVLKAMNRNYTVEKYESIIQKIREKIPETVLATDIIVGFPGETEAQFQELCDFGERMRFDFAYTAIYSPRKNTPASRMKHLFIPLAEKKERFHRFDAVIKKTAWPHRDSFIGQALEILVESSETLPNGRYKNMGRSREFFEVVFESHKPLKGQEIMVPIEKRHHYTLLGSPIGSQKKSLPICAGD